MENTGYDINKLLFEKLNYVTYSNITNEIRIYKSKMNYIKVNNKYNKLLIMLNKKQYIDDDDLYSFFFMYIYKTFPNNIKKKIYENFCDEKKEDIIIYDTYAKKIAITKIYETNKKNNLPEKLSKMILSDKEILKERYLKVYKNINKLSNEIYEKYYGYVKNIFPMFEHELFETIKCLKMFKNINIFYSNINQPIEIKLVKKF